MVYCELAKSYRQGVVGSTLQFRNFSAKGRRKSKSDGSESGEENLSKKDMALHQALDQITASFGKGAIMWLGHSNAPREVPIVSTGLLALDIALGIGGLPKGRVVEIYGPEASGKTTLALHVIAEAQKNGGYCAFVDADHALDPALAETIGVKTDNLLLSQPDCVEQALSLVDTLIQSGSVDVVVVDSVAALVPKSAPQARLMSQALQKLSHSLSLSQTILLFINQVRSKLKFYSSVRLNIKRIGLVKKGEETVGSQVLVKIVKNKHAPPFRTAQFELEFGKGICRYSEIIELGCSHKFISRSGAYYRLNDQTFHGKEALKRHLTENEEAREELAVKLREKLIHKDMEKKHDLESEVRDENVNEEIVMSETTNDDLVAAVEG